MPAHFGVKIGTKSRLGIFWIMTVGIFIGFSGQFALGRWLLLKFTSFFSVGWFKKKGPSDEEVRSGSFKMWFVGCGFCNRSFTSQGNIKPTSLWLTRLNSFSYPCSSSNPGCLASAVNNGNSVQVGLVKGDTAHDRMPHMYRETERAESGFGKGISK